MQVTGQSSTTHPFERWLAIMGAAACLIITISIWWSVSAHQSMWPLPGLYFLEIAALSMICAFLYVRDHPSRIIITWGAVGVFIAFSILGAFSVGFFYLPVALIFAIISVVSDVRNKQPIAVHLVICLFAGIAQAAVMLIAIQWLSPGVVF